MRASLLVSLLLLVLGLSYGQSPAAVSVTTTIIRGWLPAAVATRSDGSGTTFVCDAFSGSIFKLSATGSVLALFNTVNPQLLRPAGIVLREDGDGATASLYVLDAGNHRVVQLSADDGRQLSAYGLLAAGAVSNGAVQGIARDANGTLYVANSTTGSILRLDANGTALAPFLVPSYQDVFDVAVDSTGRVWVSDQQYDQLTILSAAGEFVQTVDPPHNFHIMGLAAHGAGEMFVAVRESLLNGTGAGVLRLGNTGREHAFYSLPLSEATRLAVNASGYMLVCDQKMQQVQRLTSSGQLMEALDGHRPLLNQPTGVVIDSQQNMWVADRGSCVIIKLSPAGKQLAVLTFPAVCIPHLYSMQGLAVDSTGDMYFGTAPGSSNRPLFKLTSNGTILDYDTDFGVSNGYSLAVASDDSLWVADPEAGGVIHASSNGTRLGFNETRCSLGLAVGRDDSVYTTCMDSNSVLRRSGDGQLLAVYNRTGSPAAWAKGVAVDAALNVYLTDDTNARIIKLSVDGTLLATFSSPGLVPERIAVSADGTLILASDDVDHRVVLFTVQSSLPLSSSSSSSSSGSSSPPSVSSSSTWSSSAASNGSTADSSGDKDGLSTGAVAAIVTGTTACVVLCVVLMCLFVQRRLKASSGAMDGAGGGNESNLWSESASHQAGQYTARLISG